MLSKDFAKNVNAIREGPARPVVSRKTPSNSFLRADAPLSSSTNALTMFFLREQHTQAFARDTKSSLASKFADTAPKNDDKRSTSQFPSSTVPTHGRKRTQA